MPHRIRTLLHPFLIAFLALAMLASGCGSKPTPAEEKRQGGEAAPAPSSTASAPQEREFKHALGTMKLTGQPKRIVAPYIEDALITLGIQPAAKWSLGDLVQDYLEPHLQGVPKLDFTGGLNNEALLSTNPDLIVLYTTNLAEKGAYEQYSKIAPTYVFNDATVDWKQTLKTLGDMTGTSDKAGKAIAAYDSKVANAKTKLQPFVKDKTFAVIRAKPKEIQLMDGSFYSGLVLYADLALTPHKLVKEWSWQRAQTLSLEKLPELDADYIFVLVQSETSRPLLEQFQSSPLWKNIPAVKNGHIYEMPSNYWMASGAIANTAKIDDVLKTLVK
ncbi:ABC transporter substrate-binding protein [Paenibacillus hodogayensis]|uniref:ABC transporter substrate-binding protein n=1 Tax=Paenibacillus hodogayensis TaxID=279208 RepID=A0ABV5VRV5_9BACL